MLLLYVRTPVQDSTDAGLSSPLRQPRYMIPFFPPLGYRYINTFTTRKYPTRTHGEATLVADQGVQDGQAANYSLGDSNASQERQSSETQAHCIYAVDG